VTPHHVAVGEKMQDVRVRRRMKRVFFFSTSSIIPCVWQCWLSCTVIARIMTLDSQIAE